LPIIFLSIFLKCQTVCRISVEIIIMTYIFDVKNFYLKGLRQRFYAKNELTVSCDFRRSNSREQNRFRWRGTYTRRACQRRPSLAVRTGRRPADRCQQQYRVGMRSRAALKRPLRLVFSRALPWRPPSAGRALNSSSLNTQKYFKAKAVHTTCLLPFALAKENQK
jgi:hypothetical protein